jgi:hypothetical protein
MDGEAGSRVATDGPKVFVIHSEARFDELITDNFRHKSYISNGTRFDRFRTTAHSLTIGR